MTHISILIACHNRRSQTLRCLRALEAAVSNSCSYRVILVDDGSVDGTAQAVQREFPSVVIVAGDGQLYWNGGMRVAWERAIRYQDSDYFLWLNDDTEMLPGSIAKMLQLSSLISSSAVVVGRTIDLETGEQTYGGVREVGGLRRLSYRQNGESATFCDTMNGNAVLFPAVVPDVVGLNSPRFSHSFGDFDMGLRVRRAGMDVVQLGPPVGYQSRNESALHMPTHLDFGNAKQVLLNPKGLPPREWAEFCRRHAGPLWLVYFVARYIRLSLRGLVRRANSCRGR